MSYDDSDRFEVVATKICVEPGCGKKFTITAGEKSFYESKNYTLPNRCQPCRNKRRAEKEKQKQNR